MSITNTNDQSAELRHLVRRNKTPNGLKASKQGKRKSGQAKTEKPHRQRIPASICDDNNPCTIDKWDSTHSKCIHTPVECPGGARCSQTSGCTVNRNLCQNPPNIYRTCYERGVVEHFVLNSPFEEPSIDSDELLVSGSMHLVMTQYDVINPTCNDILGLEELSLKFLFVSA